MKTGDACETSGGFVSCVCTSSEAFQTFTEDVSLSSSEIDEL